MKEELSEKKLIVVSDQSATEDTGKKPEEYFFRASAADFKKIPGNPIAYFLSESAKNIFAEASSLRDVAEPRQGLISGDTERFLRIWSEVNIDHIGKNIPSYKNANLSGFKWFPIDKGGEFRKWYGNNNYIVNWEKNGDEIRNFTNKSGKLRSRPQNMAYYFRQGVTWTKVSNSIFSVRRTPEGHIFSDAGMKAFSPSIHKLNDISGFLNSKLTPFFLGALSETINYEQGNISRLPVLNISSEAVEQLVGIGLADWDSYETSWDFTSLPLLQPAYLQLTIKATYYKLHAHWQEMSQEMQRLEEENNRIFIEAYGLQDELTPEVPLNEITLTCNPHYRYNGNKSEEELEALLLADTMKEFISYAVGCMLGRYSLDAPGLILANQGETVADYIRKVESKKCEVKSNSKPADTSHSPLPTSHSSGFQPDADNVIPILDGEWFIDDITGRFRKFLKITFGEEHYEENLKFLEDAIGKNLRKYFLKDFYPDHVKRYKKRPIYWLFSSPKDSFNALIYMHRYRPDTVSVILNDYLREFRTKLIARREHLEQVSISASASKTEKTKALKEIEKLKKTIIELEDYERDILYPLATQNIEIDLDDGVKVNYKKFGRALKKVPGLS